MADLVEALTTAWVKWENAPSSPQRVAAKEEALRALELDGNTAHDHIAQWRRQGYSVPDAIQSMFHQDQEAA